MSPLGVPRGPASPTGPRTRAQHCAVGAASRLGGRRVRRKRRPVALARPLSHHLGARGAPLTLPARNDHSNANTRAQLLKLTQGGPRAGRRLRPIRDDSDGSAARPGSAGPQRRDEGPASVVSIPSRYRRYEASFRPGLTEPSRVCTLENVEGIRFRRLLFHQEHLDDWPCQKTRSSLVHRIMEPPVV